MAGKKKVEDGISLEKPAQLEKSFADKKKDLFAVANKINAERQKTNPGAPAAIMIASDHPLMYTRSYIDTGNPAWNRALGGGLRCGMAHEVLGDPGTAKTTSCLLVLKKALERHLTCAMISSEASTFPIDQADAAGLSPDQRDDILFIPAQGSGERALNTLRGMLYDSKTGAPTYLLDCVLIDSISGLVPNAVLKSIEENGIEGNTIGRLAALSSKFYPLLVSMISPNGIILVINQLRTKISTTGHSPLEGTAGQAPRFYSKTRSMFATDSEKQKELIEISKLTKLPEPIGQAVRIKVIKNNAGGRAGATARYRYTYEGGIDVFEPVFDESTDLGVVVKPTPTSSWFLIPTPDGEEYRVNGKNNALNYLRDNPDVYTNLESIVNKARLSKSGLVDIAVETDFFAEGVTAEDENTENAVNDNDNDSELSAGEEVDLLDELE